jgi:hypothetical protein
MDLTPYVASLGRELLTAVETGGEEAGALVERLTVSMESAIRLALLEALSEAAEQMTRDLAPGSVDVRLRGRDPEFAVSLSAEDVPAAPAVGSPEPDDDGGTWRVTLRLPEHLRPRVDAAARGDGLSVNAWLVRAVAAALGGPRTARGNSGKHFSGWVR